MGTKKWTAVDYDAVKYLNKSIGSKLERVQLPKTMTLQVVIELDEELYKTLSKDPTWLDKLQQAAGDKARSALDDAAKAILVVEGKAGKFDPKTAAIFTKDLQAALETRFKIASQEMAEAAEKLFENYKKGQKELTKFRIKAVGKIAVTAVIVSAGVGVSVASMGALSPLGIVSVVRGGITVGQEITKLALSADQLAKVIQLEFKVLKKFMTDNSPKGNGAKELGLNALSKVLGLETPSLKNCRSRIELHKVDIGKIEKKSHELSKKIYEAMDIQSDWAKQFDKAKKSLPAPKVGKISTSLEKSEKALDALIKSTIKVNESVQRAEKRQELFEKTLEQMEKGIPGWVKYVDIAIGLSIDLGMGIADANSAVEKAAAVIFAAEQTIATEVIDRA